MTGRPRLLALCCCFFILTGVTAWAGCDGVPESCREDLARIEEAYRAGLREAGDEAERFEVERLRVMALAELAERTYESTLTWMAERHDSTQRFEDGQRQWLRNLHESLSAAGTAEAMREVAMTLQGRLRVFGALTGDAYCIGEGCH